MDISQFFALLPPSLQGLLGNNIFTGMILIPLLLIALDVITGVGSAIRRGQFNGQHFADFLGNDVMRYVGAAFLIFVAYITRGSAVATTLAASLGFFPLSISIINSIFTNLREMLSPAAFAQVETAAAALAGFSDPSTLSPQQLQAQYALLTSQFNQQQKQQLANTTMVQQPVILPSPSPSSSFVPPVIPVPQSSSLPVPQVLATSGEGGDVSFPLQAQQQPQQQPGTFTGN